jgi:hypothetical protein
MWSGTTSDRMCLNKAIPQTKVKCSKCKTCVGNLAHILGQCTYTKAQRIRRHDEISNFISKNLAADTANFQVIQEASVESPKVPLNLTWQ